MSFRIPLVANLLSLAVGLAPADIGLVADIDGDYTNGPDTLLMDPGDTVQVNIWITGADSLVGFGITLGDTSGALAWIEEADSLVYTTPSGWTDISIQTDSLGWVLVQSSDFAFSTPLVLPSKVAEMDFVVAPGESCGVLSANPALSGYQNTAFEVGPILLSGNPYICVSEVGLADGGEGGGLNGGGEDGDYETISTSIIISPDDYVFVNGHRVVGTVEILWSTGDPLLADGHQVLPPPNALPLSIPEERIVQLHAENLFVLSRVRGGDGWREAVLEWEAAILDVKKHIQDAYNSAWLRTSCLDSSRLAAEVAVQEYGSGLVDAENPLAWVDGAALIYWLGYPYPAKLPETVMKASPYIDPPDSVTEALASDVIEAVRAIVERPGPSLVLIPSTGGMIGLSAAENGDGSDLSSALNQIRHSTPYNILRGRLQEAHVREIVLCGGLDQ